MGGLLCAAACTSVQSSDLKTAGMSAYMQVVADGSGLTKVSAQLNVDTNATDFVDLSSGDTLVATAGGQSQTMSRVSFLGGVSYDATFSGEDALGTTYTIALNRANDLSAPSSTCVMPAPFSITGPAASATFSRANDDIVVTYSPSGTQDEMTWAAGGDCVHGEIDGSVPGDTGTFTIAKGILVPPPPPPPGSTTCQAQVTLTRSRPGQLDSHFGYGGNIVAQQVRTVMFTSTP